MRIKFLGSDEKIDFTVNKVYEVTSIEDGRKVKYRTIDDSGRENYLLENEIAVIEKEDVVYSESVCAWKPVLKEF